MTGQLDSFSPLAAARDAAASMDASWRNFESPDSSHEEAWPTTFHGNDFVLQAPGYGVIAHIAALDMPEARTVAA